VNTRSLGPHGELAGLATGITGMVATIGGAVLGTIVSQLHDGSTRTITFAIAGFLAVTAVLAREARRREGDQIS
jgi:MFS transporter, DHA1 family, multidrug resistance protein